MSITRRMFVIGALVAGLAFVPSPLPAQSGESVFYVAGHVTRAGQYPYREGLTVIDAIATAGGMTPRGSDRNLMILRIVDGEKTRVAVGLKDPVLPRDTVLVQAREQ